MRGPGVIRPFQLGGVAGFCGILLLIAFKGYGAFCRTQERGLLVASVVREQSIAYLPCAFG